jgi:hypoxanthine-DNA glycosylase
VSEVVGFPPVADAAARVLILGSMPGRTSLAMGQYYAHARNAFWFIMGALFGARPELPYEQRLEVLRRRQVAVWDVMQACHRPGSLDGRIVAASIIPNDFAAFFRGHPRVRHVFFNGAAAAVAFERQVLPGLAPGMRAVHRQRLPSTSPALAMLSREEKLERWRVVREALS